MISNTAIGNKKSSQLLKHPYLQAAQKDLRGEAIERNEAYEAFSAAC